LPAELAVRESRLAKLLEAKRALEGEARQQAEEKKAAVEARIAERHKQGVDRLGNARPASTLAAWVRCVRATSATDS
jgi:hypothetical protein